MASTSSVEKLLRSRSKKRASMEWSGSLPHHLQPAISSQGVNAERPRRSSGLCLRRITPRSRNSSGAFFRNDGKAKSKRPHTINAARTSSRSGRKKLFREKRNTMNARKATVDLVRREPRRLHHVAGRPHLNQQRSCYLSGTRQRRAMPMKQEQPEEEAGQQCAEKFHRVETPSSFLPHRIIRRLSIAANWRWKKRFLAAGIRCYFSPAGFSKAPFLPCP